MKLSNLVIQEVEKNEDEELISKAENSYKKLRSGDFDYDFEYAGMNFETKVHYILPKEAAFDVWKDRHDESVKLPRITISDDILYVVEDERLSEDQWERRDFFVKISNLFFDRYQVIIEHLNYDVDFDDPFFSDNLL